LGHQAEQEEHKAGEEPDLDKVIWGLLLHNLQGE